MRTSNKNNCHNITLEHFNMRRSHSTTAATDSKLFVLTASLHGNGALDPVELVEESSLIEEGEILAETDTVVTTLPDMPRAGTTDTKLLKNLLSIIASLEGSEMADWSPSKPSPVHVDYSSSEDMLSTPSLPECDMEPLDVKYSSCMTCKYCDNLILASGAQLDATPGTLCCEDCELDSRDSKAEMPILPPTPPVRRVIIKSVRESPRAEPGRKYPPGLKSFLEREGSSVSEDGSGAHALTPITSAATTPAGSPLAAETGKIETKEGSLQPGSFVWLFNALYSPRVDRTSISNPQYWVGYLLSISSSDEPKACIQWFRETRFQSNSFEPTKVKFIEKVSILHPLKMTKLSGGKTWVALTLVGSDLSPLTPLSEVPPPPPGPKDARRESLPSAPIASSLARPEPLMMHMRDHSTAVRLEEPSSIIEAETSETTDTMILSPSKRFSSWKSFAMKRDSATGKSSREVGSALGISHSFSSGPELKGRIPDLLEEVNTFRRPTVEGFVMRKTQLGWTRYYAKVSGEHFFLAKEGRSKSASDVRTVKNFPIKQILKAVAKDKRSHMLNDRYVFKIWRSLDGTEKNAKIMVFAAPSLPERLRWIEVLNY